MNSKFPHTYVIIFVLIILAAITTMVVPAGEYEREVFDSGGGKRELIKPDSYQQTEARL
jgi:uncharacterized ion transporter superfamily protein YfcC